MNKNTLNPDKSHSQTLIQDSVETHIKNQINTQNEISTQNTLSDDLLKEYITKDLNSMVNLDDLLSNTDWHKQKMLIDKFLSAVADSELDLVSQFFKDGINTKQIPYAKIIDCLINYYPKDKANNQFNNKHQNQAGSDILMLELLILHGLDVHCDDDSILLKSIEQNNLPFLKYLLTNFPEFETKIDSLLLLASENDFTDIIKYLIDQGADIHTIDENNCTPLFHIAISENLELIQFFISYSFEYSTPEDYREDINIVKSYGNIESINWVNHWLNSQQLSCHLENELNNMNEQSSIANINKNTINNNKDTIFKNSHKKKI